VTDFCPPASARVEENHAYQMYPFLGWVIGR